MQARFIGSIFNFFSVNSAQDITDGYASSWSSEITKTYVKIVKVGKVINAAISCKVNKSGNIVDICVINDAYLPEVATLWIPLVKDDNINFDNLGLAAVYGERKVIRLYFPDKNTETIVYFNFCYIAK